MGGREARQAKQVDGSFRLNDIALAIVGVIELPQVTFRP